MLSAADRKAARAAINAAADLAPNDASLLLARALIARAEGDLDAARDLARKARDAEPTNAELWSWVGTTTFEALGASSAGAFTKAEQADIGKAAYERALELDNTQIDAHIGLAQFYLRAPALFGGSLRKARERAAALLALKSADADSYAHLILAQIAAYRVRESEMTREFDLAAGACQSPHRKLIAINTCAWTWLLDRKNPKAALPFIQQCIDLAPEVAQHWFMLAKAEQTLGDQPGAIDAYRKSLDLQPLAPTARYELARCLDQTNAPDAADQYRRFLADHPTDPRTSAAQAALRRLAKR